MTWLDPSPLIAQALQTYKGTVREHRLSDDTDRFERKLSAEQARARKARQLQRHRAYYQQNRARIAKRRKAAYWKRKRRVR